MHVSAAERDRLAGFAVAYIAPPADDVLETLPGWYAIRRHIEPISGDIIDEPVEGPFTHEPEAERRALQLAVEHGDRKIEKRLERDRERHRRKAELDGKTKEAYVPHKVSVKQMKVHVKLMAPRPKV